MDARSAVLLALSVALQPERRALWPARKAAQPLVLSLDLSALPWVA